MKERMGNGAGKVAGRASNLRALPTCQAALRFECYARSTKPGSTALGSHRRLGIRKLMCPGRTLRPDYKKNADEMDWEEEYQKGS